MRILGIDPGLNITGYGLLTTVASSKQIAIGEAGVIRSRSGPLARRIREIFEGVAEAIATLQPDVVALEELYSHYQRPRTAILMGHARGVICLAAAQADLRIVPYAATQVKKLLTGHGRAPKAQVQQAICRELGLATVPDPPDVADALAIALCHFHLRDTPGSQLVLRDQLNRASTTSPAARRGLPPRNTTT